MRRCSKVESRCTNRPLYSICPPLLPITHQLRRQTAALWDWERALHVQNHPRQHPHRQAHGQKAKKPPRRHPHGLRRGNSPEAVIDASSTQAGIARYASDCRAKNKNKRGGQCSGSNSKFSMAPWRRCATHFKRSARGCSCGGRNSPA